MIHIPPMRFDRHGNLTPEYVAYALRQQRIAVLESRISVMKRQLVRDVGVLCAFVVVTIKAQLWAVSL